MEKSRRCVYCGGLIGLGKGKFVITKAGARDIHKTCYKRIEEGDDENKG